MNVFAILVGLCFFGLFVSIVVAVIVAFFTKKWKVAIGLVGIFIVGFGLLCLLMWAGDPYVRSPVAPGKVAGTFSIDSDRSIQQLSKMGYKKFGAKITLDTNGTFIATDLPACCIHGQDESVWPFSGGYYSLTGTWEVTKSTHADLYVVRLVFVSSELIEQQAQITDPISNDRRAPQNLEVYLMNGSPLSIGFSVFNGDFYEILFTRDKKQRVPVGNAAPNLQDGIGREAHR